MGKPRSFEKPMGFRDHLPPFAHKKRWVEGKLQEQFFQWGYDEICTPTLEFHETVGNASAVSEQRMFKCMDREGNTLVLKPDQTAPIARVVASVLKEEPLPVRLCYHTSVFRAQENETGRKAEYFQSGVELIGITDVEGDAEVIMLAMEVIKACEIKSFQLAIGHIGWLDAWMRERLDNEIVIHELKSRLEQRDLAGYRQLIEELSLTVEVHEELLAILRVQATPLDFRFYRQRTRSATVKASLDQLQEVWDLLDAFGFGAQVVFDPSLTGNVGYYTGIVFEGYASGSGFPLLSGGRYDQLLENFNRSLPATGFALQTDRLLEESPLTKQDRPIVEVFYSHDQRHQAFAEAKKGRANGKRVILQRIATGQQIPVCDDKEQIMLVADEGESHHDQ